MKYINSHTNLWVLNSSVKIIKILEMKIQSSLDKKFYWKIPIFDFL